MEERDLLSAALLIAPTDRASEHLGALGRRWWLILACALIAGGLGYTLSSSQQRRYEAAAKVLLSSAEPVNLLNHATPAPSLDPERELNTDVALVKLDSVAGDVLRQLHLPLTNIQLLREVSVSADGLTNLLSITATDHSPSRAAAIANAFAAHYIVVRRTQAQDAYATAAALAQQRLAQLTDAQRAGAQGRALRQQMQQLQATGALQTGGAQLVDRAEIPTTSSSPRPKFSAIVAAFVGAILGGLAAIGAGYADRRRERLAALAATNGHATHEPPMPDAPAERPLPSPSHAVHD